MRKWRRWKTAPERLALIQRMNEMLDEDCPIILEFSKAYYVATQPWARWTHNNPILEGGFNKYHYIDPVLRARLQPQWNEKPLWPGMALGGLIAVGLGYAGPLEQAERCLVISSAGFSTPCRSLSASS
jgi:hypothetical protein